MTPGPPFRRFQNLPHIWYDICKCIGFTVPLTGASDVAWHVPYQTYDRTSGGVPGGIRRPFKYAISYDQTCDGVSDQTWSNIPSDVWSDTIMCNQHLGGARNSVSKFQALNRKIEPRVYAMLLRKWFHRQAHVVQVGF